MAPSSFTALGGGTGAGLGKREREWSDALTLEGGGRGGGGSSTEHFFVSKNGRGEPEVHNKGSADTR